MFKFTANAADITRAIAALPFPTEKVTICRKVKISVGTNEVVLTSSDKENFATVTLSAKTEGFGEVLTDAAQLKKVLGKSKESATFEVDDNNDINITIGGSALKLEGMATDAFPSPATVNNKVKLFTVDTDTFVMAFDTVEYAVANETIYSLSGIMIEVNEDSLDFATSDTHRLATINVNAEVENKANVNYLLSTLKTAKKLAKGGKITFYANKNDKDEVTGVILAGENFNIAASIKEGLFPRWREVIPSNMDFKFLLPVVETVKVLKELLPLTNEVTNAVDAFTKDGKIAFRACETGSVAVTNIDATGFWGFTINANYLIESLQQCDGTAIVTTGERNPLCIRDGISIHVVSPVYPKSGVNSCPCCGNNGNYSAVQTLRTKLACSPDCAAKADKAYLDGTLVTLPAKTAAVKVEKEFKVTAKMVKDLLNTIKATTSITTDEEAWKFVVDNMK